MKKNLLSLLFVSVLCSGSFAQITQWSDTFINGVTPTTTQVNAWNAWRAQLTPNQYCQMWIGGTYDTIGRFCSDTSVVRAFAMAIQNYTSYTSPSACNGNVWSICNRYQGEIWLNPPSQCDGNNCPVGYIIRVGIGNSNWGGVNTATCSTNPSQRMTLRFYTGGGTPGQITGPDTVCYNTTHTYSVAPVPGATFYSWSVPTGAAIMSGQGSNGVSIQFGTTSGTVSVFTTPSCGTPVPATLNVGVFSCANVDEINFALAGISLFPNPASESTTLHFNSPMGNLAVEVLDLQGRVVYTASENVASANTDKTIAISGLANGVYAIRVICGDNVYTDKLVIRK